MSAWDYGPGDDSASANSLSFSEMLSGGSKALTDIIQSANNIKAALANTSVSTNSRTDAATGSSGVPVWMWLVGAIVLYKVAKG